MEMVRGPLIPLLQRVVWLFFFFQAEDGIRDFHVTGVQTCALPISVAKSSGHWMMQRPRWVAIFAADHVYRMDVSQMLAAHRRAGEGITVAAMPVPLAEASAFGVLRTGPDDVVVGFDEKPQHPGAMPGRPDFAYASMGNYVFDFRALRDALLRARAQGHVDFGRDVLPAALGSERVVAY